MSAAMLSPLVAGLFAYALFELFLERELRTFVEQYGIQFKRGGVPMGTILKNANRPLTFSSDVAAGTLAGFQFIGGTVIVERLFSYEGLGNLAIDAVINRDLPMIQGVVVFSTLCIIVFSIMVDIAYAWIDPRVRVSRTLS